MSPGAMAALFALVVLAGVVVFLVVATWNAVVALEQRIDKAWANVDVALKQRHDQLPALLDAVRGVLAFERDTLTRVAAARAAYSPTAPILAQAAVAAETTAAVRSLFAVVEAYPEAKSAANVLDLQDEIERLEGLIADRRELYNDQAYRHNARIGQVPAVLLAPLFGWRDRPFFRAEDSERIRPEAILADPAASDEPGAVS